LSVHGSTAADSSSAREHPSDAQNERRRLYRSLLRICTVTPAVFAVYALAPLDGMPGVEGTLVFMAAVAAFAGLVGYQILAVIRSPFPVVRAIEAATMCVPLLVVMFSTTYFLSSRADAQSFNEPLSRLDAVYFTTTVFATVGFGDVAATSQTTRAMVSVQMALDLVVVGLFARVLLKAAERRRGAMRDHPPS
jgi:voltage-gated potassium channel